MFPDEFTPDAKPRATKPGRKPSAKGARQKRPLSNLTNEHKLFTGAELAVVLGAMIVSLGAAFVLHVLVERPSLRLAAQLKRRR